MSTIKRCQHCGMALADYNNSGFCTTFCANGGGYKKEGFVRVAPDGSIINHNTRKPGTPQHRWSNEDKQLLKEHYHTKTPQELCALFPDRSWQGIYGKALMMGMLGKPYRIYTNS